MELSKKDNNQNGQQQKREISQLLNQILPVYMQIELKNNKKPVHIGSNFSLEKLNHVISKRFPTSSQNLITQEKLDKIYEGIIDIVKFENETGMIFKNVVDVEIVKMYFYPDDLKNALLITTINNTNIIILTFSS